MLARPVALNVLHISESDAAGGAARTAYKVHRGLKEQGHVSRMLVGRKAYDTWVKYPQNTQPEFKCWMGFSDKLQFPASGRAMSAEELSAEVLKSLRADATRHSGQDVDAAREALGSR